MMCLFSDFWKSPRWAEIFVYVCTIVQISRRKSSQFWTIRLHSVHFQKVVAQKVSWWIWKSRPNLSTVRKNGRRKRWPQHGRGGREILGQAQDARQHQVHGYEFFDYSNFRILWLIELFGFFQANWVNSKLFKIPSSTVAVNNSWSAAKNNLFPTRFEFFD